MPGSSKRKYLLCLAGVFIGLPLLLWASGDFPRRNSLSESLSLATLLAFSLMLSLFFLTRANRSAATALTMRSILRFHKIIGYIAALVLLLHPFFIVLPRHFNAGVTPTEAFATMMKTRHNPALLAGIIAWCLLLILTVTALLRKRLPLKYTTWRAIHGALAIPLMMLATWHTIRLGRHINWAVSAFLIVLTTGGVLLLWKTYIADALKKKGDKPS